MGADQLHDWRAEATSALAWWRDAGVDIAVADEPRDWLAPIAPRAPAQEPVAPPPAAIPAMLDAFLAWRTGPDAPERGWGGDPLPAEGPADAPLMVLIEQPEREDARERRLLTGACGRLFDRMLAAIGVARDTVHLVSIAACRPTSGRIPADALDQLDELARHHVALVRPRFLLLLGNGPCRVMLGDLCHQSRGSLRALNQDGATQALATFHPQQLVDRPQLKAESWRDLQMLIGKLDR